MRKASRQMDAAFALEVLDKAPYVTVSMTRPDGTPYGLPLSLARTDERTSISIVLWRVTNWTDKEGEEMKYGRME